MPAANRTRRSGSPILPAALAIPAILSLFGWVASYFYSVVNSDVTMPDWSVNLLNFAAELLPALYGAVLAAFVVCLVWTGAGAGQIVLAVASAILANAVFGLIATWIAQGYGEFNPLTALLTAVCSALAALIAVLMKKRWRKAKTSHARQSSGVTRAAVLSVLPAAVLPVLYAVLDLAEHFGSRSAYSDEDFARGVVFFLGTVVRRLIVYVFLGMRSAWFIADRFGKRGRGE